MGLVEGEVRFHTEPDGRLVLDVAPPVARVSLQALQQFDQRLVRISGNVIRFADQVIYRVTGWDEHSSALLLEHQAGGSTPPAEPSKTRPLEDPSPVPHTTV